MKTTTKLLTTATSISLAALISLASAADENAKGKHDHDHDHKMAGPNGGKILHEVDPHAELLVTKDRKLQLTFVNHDGKPIKLGGQSASGICGKRTSPTRLKFAEKGNSLVSDKAIPKGMLIPTVLQVKMGKDAKTKIIRLNLNLEDCPTCDYLEYACTCDHHHDHE